MTLDELADLLVAEDRMLKEELIRLRLWWDLSIDEVAERMGVSRDTVLDFEAYYSNPTQSVLRRYALAVHARVSHSVSLRSIKEDE